MTIEVRQMTISSTVSGPSAPEAQGDQPPSASWLEQLREELLAECRAMVEDRLQKARER